MKRKMASKINFRSEKAPVLFPIFSTSHSCFIVDVLIPRKKAKTAYMNLIWMERCILAYIFSRRIWGKSSCRINTRNQKPRTKLLKSQPTHNNELDTADGSGPNNTPITLQLNRLLNGISVECCIWFRFYLDRHFRVKTAE